MFITLSDGTTKQYLNAEKLFETDEGKRVFRHTASHIMAQAVKRLFPDVKLAIGPATAEGFYYDFDKDKPFTSEEILAIEEEMRAIIKEDLPLERSVMPRAEATAFFEKAGEPYKAELIRDLPEDSVISLYKQGDFIDLCAGPHLQSTKYVKAFRLESDGGSSGAYWRGSEKNKMLCRIYGTAFPKQSELEAYLKEREEARKRDHNKLGRELRFFTTSELIGQGLPLLMPKGTKVVQILQRFVEDEEERRGYLLTKTPFMAKPDLFRVSGHLDHYREGMFFVGGDSLLGDTGPEQNDEVFCLRPMTCPFQFEVYNAEQHSYKDLPIRYNETSSLFRKESSGEMHGLIRLRQFTISEGHIVCTREQVAEEFRQCVDLVKYMMTTVGIQDDVTYRFSKWDPNDKAKYMGEPALWEETQDNMRALLNELGIKFTEAEGEAAFYGPKLDVQCKNVYGKEDTLITIQVDFQLGERFNMVYIDREGNKKHPFVLHRTSIGCYERTLALLIEKYAASFPTWLAPVQAIVLPISDKYNAYAEGVLGSLKSAGIRAEGDFRAEKIGYKIREARSERIPYIAVVGEKEAESGNIALRSRAGDEGTVGLDAFIARVLKEIAERTNNSAIAQENQHNV